jgi:uncharacterized protein
MDVGELLFSANVSALEKALNSNVALANEPIPLRDNAATAHPLHRICDGVFSGYYDEDTGIVLAKLFVTHGAQINPVTSAGKDSPLTTACSLSCDKIALYYIDLGADIHHPGCYGGTALHWAAWCGRDSIVKELLERNAEINKLCTEFKSTPLFWAAHGHRFGDKSRHHQLVCARLLLQHGADASIPNFEGYKPVQLLDEDVDQEFIALFR